MADDSKPSAHEQNQEQVEVDDLQTTHKVTTDDPTSSSSSCDSPDDLGRPAGPLRCPWSPSYPGHQSLMSQHASPTSTKSERSALPDSKDLRMPESPSSRGDTNLSNPTHSSSFIVDKDIDRSATVPATESQEENKTDTSDLPHFYLRDGTWMHARPRFQDPTLRNPEMQAWLATITPEDMEIRRQHLDPISEQDNVAKILEASLSAASTGMETPTTVSEVADASAAEEATKPPKSRYSIKFIDTKAEDAQFLATEVPEAPESVGEEQSEMIQQSSKRKGKEPATAENSVDTENLITATKNLVVDESKATSLDDGKGKVDYLKEAMLRALEQGDALLWENNVGWDVMIHCRGYRWRVHRQILCEESPEWMAIHLPPTIGSAPTIWALHSHEPTILGTVLQFMYKQKFEHGEMSPDSPLETASVVTNVAMFVAGASVMCRSMMDTAIDNMEAASEIVEGVAPNLVHVDVDRFQEPIHRALGIMYDQPNQWVMRSMRLVMSKFMATFYGFIILNENWAAQHEESWKDVHGLIMQDNMYFGKGACLRPVPPTHRALLNAALMQAYNRDQAARGGQYQVVQDSPDPQTPPTPQARQTRQARQVAGARIVSTGRSRGRGKGRVGVVAPTNAQRAGPSRAAGSNMSQASTLAESEAETSPSQSSKD